MDPYVYPDTATLINKFGIKDAEKLSHLEGELFALKSLEPLPSGNLDYAHLKAIHYHFFNDFYEWAGQERTVDIAKQDSYFGNVNYIEKELNKLFKKLKEDNYLQNLSQQEFCKKLSYYFNEINAAHPFREGNGRSLRAFSDLLGEQAGYCLNWRLLQGRRQEYIEANIQGFLHGNYTPMEAIFNEITSPLKVGASVSKRVIDRAR